VTAEYRHESVSGTASADVSQATTKLEGTLVAGFEGFSVGGQASFDTDKNEVDDFNFGAEYSQNDFTATLKTAKKADEVVAGYFHNIPSKLKLKTQVGGQLNVDLAKNTRVYTFGAEHDVDDFTTVKGKVNSESELAGVVEHRLTNPFLKVALSGSWNGKAKSTQPEKFGVALTFGDY